MHVTTHLSFHLNHRMHNSMSTECDGLHDDSWNLDLYHSVTACCLIQNMKIIQPFFCSRSHPCSWWYPFLPIAINNRCYWQWYNHAMCKQQQADSNNLLACSARVRNVSTIHCTCTAWYHNSRITLHVTWVKSADCGLWHSSNICVRSRAGV